MILHHSRTCHFWNNASRVFSPMQISMRIKWGTVHWTLLWLLCSCPALFASSWTHIPQIYTLSPSSHLATMAQPLSFSMGPESWSQFKSSKLKVNFHLPHSSILHNTPPPVLPVEQEVQPQACAEMCNFSARTADVQLSWCNRAARGTKAVQHYWNTKPAAPASNKLQFMHKLHISESLS